MASNADNIYAPQALTIKSEVETKLMNWSFKKRQFEFEFIDGRMYQFKIMHKNQTEAYICSIN
jgi:hypothetical protein